MLPEAGLRLAVDKEGGAVQLQHCEVITVLNSIVKCSGLGELHQSVSLEVKGINETT